MTVPTSTDKRSSLIPEKPITGVDLQRLIASIQQHDTDIIIEGYGTANVALSLSFDNDSVYKLNKNYLRHSLNGNSLRDSDEIKKELLASVLCNESLSNIQILRQNKVRILNKKKLGDMHKYFMFMMESIDTSKQIIGDYKNIDNFGKIDGQVKIIDSELLVDLLDDMDTIEFSSLMEMIANDFVDYMITTQKYHDVNDETSLLHLIIGLCCIAELTDSAIKKFLQILKNNPYCTDEHYHIFEYLLGFVRSDWREKCTKIDCFSLRTTLDLFCMKIAFAKTYYAQSEEARCNLSHQNSQLIRDIQLEHNPVLMVNRLSAFLFRKPSWYEFFMEKLSFFKPVLCKFDCLSALNFFCKDTIKKRFLENQNDAGGERVSVVNRLSGFFSFLKPSYPVSVPTTHSPCLVSLP
ncbi:MAG: hypothetical protein CL816_01285 [Coxiellaceae bacterium]|nr:hypothetical protein [Coxiellaceae bacterium]